MSNPNLYCKAESKRIRSEELGNRIKVKNRWYRNESEEWRVKDQELRIKNLPTAKSSAHTRLRTENIIIAEKLTRRKSLERLGT